MNGNWNAKYVAEKVSDYMNIPKFTFSYALFGNNFQNIRSFQLLLDFLSICIFNDDQTRDVCVFLWKLLKKKNFKLRCILLVEL